MCYTIKISKMLSKAPGPGRIEEGANSGQLFREEILAPIVKRCIGSEQKLIVDLDNTIGYGVSFLKNAFGDLVSIDGLKVHEVLRVLEIVSEEEEYLKDDIIQYIKEGNNQL